MLLKWSDECSKNHELQPNTEKTWARVFYLSPFLSSCACIWYIIVIFLLLLYQGSFNSLEKFKMQIFRSTWYSKTCWLLHTNHLKMWQLKTIIIYFAHKSVVWTWFHRTSSSLLYETSVSWDNCTLTWGATSKMAPLWRGLWRWLPARSSPEAVEWFLSTWASPCEPVPKMFVLTHNTVVGFREQ